MKKKTFKLQFSPNIQEWSIKGPSVKEHEANYYMALSRAKNFAINHRGELQIYTKEGQLKETLVY